jgi:hypothetical protein
MGQEVITADIRCAALHRFGIAAMTSGFKPDLGRPSNSITLIDSMTGID